MHTITESIESVLKVTVQDIGNDLIDGKIKCRGTYKFKILDENQEIILGMNIRIKSLKQVKSIYNTINYYEVIKGLEPNEDGIYTIENVNRDITVLIGNQDGDVLEETDENGVTWKGTFEGGYVINLRYSEGDINKTVSIPGRLCGYQITSVSGSYDGSRTKNMFLNYYRSEYPTQKIREVILPEQLKTIGSYSFEYCDLANITIPSNVTSIGYGAFGNSRLTDIYIENLEENMNLNSSWKNSCNAYVHFSDCKHSVEKIAKPGVLIEDVTNNLEEGKINCGETYKFKIIDNDGIVLTNERVVIKSQGEYTSGEEIKMTIKPDQEGIYTIEKVERDKVICVQELENGEKIQTTDENGITWEYTYRDGEATDVKYKKGELGEKVTIPNVLDGCNVISITGKDSYNNMFSNKNAGVKEIILPESITSLGNYSFNNSTDLEKINIPNNVTEINECVFNGCSSLKSLDMLNVTTIGNSAFSGCNSLIGINIPNIITIGDYAFYCCSALKNIDLSSVKTVGGSAFGSCSSLTEIDLSNIESINEWAFHSCYNLADIYVNNTEDNTKISNSYGVVHYKDCKHDIKFEKYTNVYSTIQEISSNVQDDKINCRDDYKFRLLNENGEVITSEKVLVRLSSIEFDENSEIDRMTRILDNSSNMFSNSQEGVWELNPDENGVYTIEKVHRNATIIIGSYQATDENGVTWNYSYENGNAINVYYAEGELEENVVIPSYLNGYPVTKLYNKQESGNIFSLAENTSQIKNIKISDNITNIGEFAFYKLESLEKIETCQNVIDIGKAAFYNCNNLSEIQLTNSLKTIGSCAFYNCNNLDNLNNLENVTSIGEAAFVNCSMLSKIDNLNKVHEIKDQTFRGCSNLKNIEISNVTSIGRYAFNNCSSLISIEIPNAISIKNSAFSGCNSLTTIEIPNVTSIYESTFSECSSLTNIELSNVESIGSYAFSNCTNLKNVIIPANVTNIGYSAFKYWTSNQTINIKEQEKPSGWDYNWNIGCSANIVWGYKDE